MTNEMTIMIAVVALVVAVSFIAFQLGRKLEERDRDQRENVADLYTAIDKIEGEFAQKFTDHQRDNNDTKEEIYRDMSNNMSAVYRELERLEQLIGVGGHGTNRRSK